MLSWRYQRAELISERKTPGTSFADIFGASFLTFQGDASLPAARATSFGFAGTWERPSATCEIWDWSMFTFQRRLPQYIIGRILLSSQCFGPRRRGTLNSLWLFFFYVEILPWCVLLIWLLEVNSLMVLLFLKERLLFRIGFLFFPSLQPCQELLRHTRINVEGGVFFLGWLPRRSRSRGILCRRLQRYSFLTELFDLFDR